MDADYLEEFTESPENFTEAGESHWVTDWTWYLPIPFCGTLGLLGNSLITMVMLRDRFKGHSMKVHLLSLALSDTVIILSYFYFWICLFVRLDESDIICKIFMALRHVFLPLGSWSVVFISIERCYIVCYPHKAKLMDGFRLAVTSEVILGALSLGLGIPVTILTGRNSVTYCKSYGDNLSIYGVFVTQLMRCATYYVFPFIVITICSCISVVKLRKNAAFWENAAVNRSNSKNTLFATRMLIIIGVVFAVTTIPYGVYKLSKVFSSGSMDYTLDRVLPVVLNLNLVNHCVNFYQYCLTGAFFREELREICCHSDKEVVVSQVQQRF